MAPSIVYKNVSKRYRLGRGSMSLRSLFGRLGRAKEEYHWAVQDVSFELQPGQALGIIGPNGAGKTTTLKLLSQVTQPTSGEIQMNGRFSALIELGAGFHPDLTGRENVFLNGTILGMPKSEIRTRFDQIVEFAGIEKYLDTPVKRYSSGMYARLGFSIAAHVDPDILLVDEVLAVGDYAFRMKCYNRMDELRANGTSLIFVSHNMEDVRRVCDIGLVMYQGQCAFQGSAPEAVAEYANVLRDNASKEDRAKNFGSDGLSQRRMTGGARIEKVEIIDEDGHPQRAVDTGERACIAVEIQFLEDAECPVFACAITNEKGETVYDITTRLMNLTTPNYKAGERVVVKYTIQTHLLGGIYRVRADLAYNDLSCYYDFAEDALNFVVVGGGGANGIANLNADISFEKLAPLEPADINLDAITFETIQETIPA